MHHFTLATPCTISVIGHETVLYIQSDRHQGSLLWTIAISSCSPSRDCASSTAFVISLFHWYWSVFHVDVNDVLIIPLFSSCRPFRLEYTGLEYDRYIQRACVYLEFSNGKDQVTYVCVCVNGVFVLLIDVEFVCRRLHDFQ